MIDLNSLKNIDFKNFDLQKKIIPLLLQNKDLLAQVVVVGLTVLILFLTIGRFGIDSKQYSDNLADLKNKTEVIQDLKSETTKSKQFFSNLPKNLDEDQFSSLISDYATQSKIAILTFAPALKKTEGPAEISVIRMTVKAKSYNDFLFFVKTLEQSAYKLRIDVITLTSDATSSSSANGEQDGSLQIQLEVSSVVLNK